MEMLINVYYVAYFIVAAFGIGFLLARLKMIKMFEAELNLKDQIIERQEEEKDALNNKIRAIIGRFEKEKLGLAKKTKEPERKHAY
jgi:hypothetical protein